jgi:hypothetical protein
MRLPDPMLSRPGTLPLGSGFSYEVRSSGDAGVIVLMWPTLIGGRPAAEPPDK